MTPLTLTGTTVAAMGKWLLTVGLVCQLALMGGPASLLPDAPCADDCTDDRADGTCQPNCADCVCCQHLPVASAVVSGLSAVCPVVMVVAPSNELAPSLPEPDDISHVPKTHLG